MLARLSIRDIVLIERLDIDFSRGLAVLTGETGAGKSILLDAFALALGGRGDAGLVRHGVEQGQVAAVFDVPKSHPSLTILRDNGLENPDSENAFELILRRVQLADGRTRAFINDQAVSVQTTTHVSTPVVVSTPLPCHWGVPTPPMGQAFDPTKVNVQFTPPGATAPVKFGHVSSEAACAQTTEDAWYYDSESNPTEVLVCPNTCDGTLKNSAGAQVELLFGCATEPAKIH